MRNLITVMILSLLFIGKTYAAADLIAGKFYAEYMQPDPFDKTKEYTHLRYDGYNHHISCKIFAISAPYNEYAGFDSFTFPAQVKVKRENGEVISFANAQYSTGTSIEIVSRSRNYLISTYGQEYKTLINAMKSDNKITFAMKWHKGWETSEIDLKGFTKAYSVLNCK